MWATVMVNKAFCEFMVALAEAGRAEKVHPYPEQVSGLMRTKHCPF